MGGVREVGRFLFYGLLGNLGIDFRFCSGLHAFLLEVVDLI